MTVNQIDWREVIFDLIRAPSMPEDFAAQRALFLQQIDWSVIIKELREVPMQRVEIAKAVDGFISEAQIRAYAEENASPGHFRGELLLDLWMRKTGKRREDAPMRPAYLRAMPSARSVKP